MEQIGKVFKDFYVYIVIDRDCIILDPNSLNEIGKVFLFEGSWHVMYNNTGWLPINTALKLLNYNTQYSRLKVGDLVKNKRNEVGEIISRDAVSEYFKINFMGAELFYNVKDCEQLTIIR